MLLRLLGQLRHVFLARNKRVSGDKPASPSDPSSVVPAMSEEEARRAVASMPTSAEAHTNLGIIYLRANRLAAAEEELFLATKLQRDNAVAHYNLGKVLEGMNRLSGAEASYRRTIELMPTLAEPHNRLGMILAATGRPEQAEASYRLALKLKPDFSAARDNLERVLEESERELEIEARLRSALESAPDSVDAHLNLGLLLGKLRRLDEAESVFRRAIELQPDNAFAHFGQGVVFWNASRPYEAEKAYRHALRLAPDFADAHHSLGLLLVGTRRFEEAEACYRRALELKPDFASAHRSLGMVLERTYRVREAETCYRRALALDPKFEEARANLENVLLEIKRLRDSVAAYRRELERFPRDAMRHYRLGNALLSLGEVEEALAAFTQALALEPHCAEAHNGLGMVRMIEGDLDSAIACFLMAVSRRQDFSRAMCNAGAAFFKKGDLAAARTWSQSTLAVNPEHVEANFQMALLSVESGDLDEANRYFERARTRPPSLGIEIATHPKRSVLVLGIAKKGGNMSPKTVEFLFPANFNTRITWAVDLADDDEVDDLPHYDLVFNALGDPDNTGNVGQPLGRFLQTCTTPVLNHPEKVMSTARNNLGHLLKGIDNVFVPEVWRFADSTDWDDAMIQYLPLLIRPVDSHGGVGLVLTQTADELAQVRAMQSSPVYVTRFVDFRSDDKFFRKYRVAFVDRKPYPYHLAISPNWLVHYYSAEMEDHQWKLEEEKQFLEDPEAALGRSGMRAIRSIGARMDLDYAAIDFSMMSDGRVLVFESTPTMLVHPENLDGPLSHKNPYIFQIASKFEEMLVKITSAAAKNPSVRV